MTTTRKISLNQSEGSKRGASASAPRLRRAMLIAAFTLVGFMVGAWDLSHTAWYQERRLSRLSLSQLQQERDGRLNDPRLLYYIGLRLNQQGRCAEADPYLRNAVGIDPDTPRLRDAWMQALLGSGLTTAAFGEVREFAGTHPNSAEAHLILGKFYVTQDSMIRATEELTRAVTLDPALGEAWSLLAVAQTRLDHTGEAQAAALKAVALRPRSAADRLGLALLFAHHGQRKEAMDSFQSAIALDPKSAAAHEEYAHYIFTANQGDGDIRLAETEARRALDIAPGSPLALETQGQALAAEGQGNSALSLLLQAAYLRPRDPSFALVLSQAYDRQGLVGPQRVWQAEYRKRQDRTQKEQDLVTAILKAPDDPQPQRRLARMLADEGDVAGCLRHLSKALRCAPDAPPAQAAAAENLAAADHAAEALPLARRAVAVAPKSTAAQEALGDVLLALGQPENALASYRVAAGLTPNRTSVYQNRLDRYAHKQ